MKYRIKIENPQNSGNFIWWSLSGNKKDMLNHLKWAISYYPNEIFKLVTYSK